MEGKYLNEEEYQKNNQKVKKTGKILLIIGIIVTIVSAILLVLGVVVLKNAAVNAFDETAAQPIIGGMFGSFGLIAFGGTLGSIGFILMVAGGIVMIVAHRREITAYTTQQVMPVAKEGIEQMSPTIGKAAGDIAKGIKEGLNAADNGKNNAE